MSFLTILFYIVFILAAIVLIVVVLLQEGRGGGFGEALGTHGRETFGAGNRGINTFTAATAGVFLASALLIHILNREAAGSSVIGNQAGSGQPTLNSFPEPGAGGAVPPSPGN